MDLCCWKDGERFPGILAHCENKGCFEWNFQQILSYIPVATTQNYNLIRWTFPLLSPRPKCAYKYPIGVTLWALVLDYTIQNRSHFFRITRNHWGLQYCKDMRSRKNLSSYPFEVHSVKNSWKIPIVVTLLTFVLHYTIQNRSHFFRVTRNKWGLQYCKKMRTTKNLLWYPFEVHSVKNPWKIHIEATLFTFFLR